MLRLISALALIVISCASAMAEPTVLLCQTSGPTHRHFGTLALHVDLDRRRVQIDYPERFPWTHTEYRDSTLASIYSGKIYPWMFDEIVHQFVIINPSTIEVGWRDDTGELIHLAWFNRSALRKHGPSCRWHSAWEFAVS